MRTCDFVEGTYFETYVCVLCHIGNGDRYRLFFKIERKKERTARDDLMTALLELFSSLTSLAVVDVVVVRPI